MVEAARRSSEGEDHLVASVRTDRRRHAAGEPIEALVGQYD
jgi:hypothetical protein